MKMGVTIGELAKELHLNPKTIRYYEEVGLLPEPRRSESGYRLYSRYEAERLRLVRRAKLLGLSLAEIKELVGYAVDGRCHTLEQRLLSLVEAKLGEVGQKMRDMATFREELMRYKHDLSNRLESVCHEEYNAAAQSSCRCIGDGTFPGLGEGNLVRKEEKAMADKVKKEPKTTSPKTECGCGCLPVKK